MLFIEGFVIKEPPASIIKFQIADFSAKKIAIIRKIPLQNQSFCIIINKLRKNSEKKRNTSLVLRILLMNNEILYIVLDQR